VHFVGLSVVRSRHISCRSCYTVGFVACVGFVSFFEGLLYTLMFSLFRCLCSLPI
jgi:hypothetical protein